MSDYSENLSGAETAAEPEALHVDGQNLTEVLADQVQMSQSSAGKIVAQEINISESGILSVKAGHATIAGSGVGLLHAGTVSLEDSRSGIIIAQEISASSNRSIVTIARRIDGNVETFMDQRGMLTLGITTGLLFGFIYLIGKLLLGRKG